jgi:hypothetical protein
MDEPIDAANMFWKSLTKHIAGHVPQFAFTISDNDNNLYSYVVKENKRNSRYTIKEIDVDIDVNDILNYHGHVTELVQSKNRTVNPLSSKRIKVKLRESESDDDSGFDGYEYDESSSTSAFSDSDDEGVFSDIDIGMSGSRRADSTPIAMFNYTTRYYHQADGPTIKYDSTSNPKIDIVNIPNQKRKVKVLQTVPGHRYRRSFSSIPSFKEPLLPIVNIWDY